MAAAACAQYGMVLEIVDDELKKNERVVMAALTNVRGYGLVWCGVV